MRSRRRALPPCVSAVATMVGANCQQIADAADIPRTTLTDRDGRTPVQVLYRALDEIGRATNDDGFGLRIAKIRRRRPDNALALAVASSPTLGEALHRTARYMRLLHDGAAVLLVPDRDVVQVRYEVLDPRGPHRFGSQMALAYPCLIGRETMGERFRVERVAFSHAAPRDLSDYARMFQAPVAFGQPYDELSLRPALLSEPFEKADSALCKHLDRHLDLMLAQLPRDSDFLAHVRRAIGEDLRGQLPQVDGVATRLHMSARSLQRRLLASGTTFQKQLDRVRHQLSLRYLDDNLAVSEVAFLLGYSEPSNFHRAFKRWTGLTPAEARTRARAGAI